MKKIQERMVTRLNRKMRRSMNITKKEKVYTVTESQIRSLKQDATKEAVDEAFFLMLAIPVMVIHDKYSKLMPKVVDGKSRAERFAEMCLDLYDSYEKDYVSIDDLKRCLKEETGMTTFESRDRHLI